MVLSIRLANNSFPTGPDDPLRLNPQKGEPGQFLSGSGILCNYAIFLDDFHEQVTVRQRPRYLHPQ